MVELTALPGPSDAPDLVDVMRLGFRATVITYADREYVVLDDGFHRLRLDVLSGTVREGPVQPLFQVRGLSSIEPKLVTLSRIGMLARLGRCSGAIWPLERRMPRWVDMLRVHDAVQEGASQREIAVALFGAERIATDWQGGSDSLRSHVRRLIKLGQAMAAGGYRRLLREK